MRAEWFAASIFCICLTAQQAWASNTAILLDMSRTAVRTPGAGETSDSGLSGGEGGLTVQRHFWRLPVFFAIAEAGVHHAAGQIQNQHGFQDISLTNAMVNVGGGLDFVFVELQETIGIDYGLSGMQTSSGSSSNLDYVNGMNINSRLMAGIIPALKFGVGLESGRGVLKFAGQEQQHFNDRRISAIVAVEF